MLPSDSAQHVLLHQQLLQRRLAATSNVGTLPQTSSSNLSAAFAAAVTAPLTAMAIRNGTGVDSGRFQIGLPSTTSVLLRSDASSLLQLMVNADHERRLQQQRCLSVVHQQAQQIQQQLQQQTHLQHRTPEGLVASSSKRSVGTSGASSWSRYELGATNNIAPHVKSLLRSLLPRVSETGTLAGFTEKLQQQRAEDPIDSQDATSIESREAREAGPAEMNLLKKMQPLPPGTSRKDSRWDEMYQELIRYRSKTGSCIVPRGFAGNPRLASWVAEQRKQYKLMKDGHQSSITAKRVELLNQVEFAWNAQEAAWEKHMVDLKIFKAKYGHCNVPLNEPQFPKLGLWVKEQRRHFTLMKQGKQSHMTEARCAELDSVGFCWDTHESTWLERLNELLCFKKENGHCIVPTNYPQNPKLGTWIHHQRRQYKKHKEGKACHITADRIKALDSLGFVWHPRDKGSEDDAWEETRKTEPDLASLDLRPRKRQRSM